MTTEQPAGVSVGDCRLIDLPKILDTRGNLTFVEGVKHIPFAIERVYWIYDVPGGETRGGHAYRRLDEFLISLSGSFDVVLDDGGSKRTVQLNRSYYGLFVPRMIWRHLENFSTNAVCLILASTAYDESDYVRDYAQYGQMRQGR
ncbi:MAG TPA: FdtA/QdtA family cupin domain-containing protein [Thermoanaerobaculia bacterium]|nr:FdtA/QdtA family cupin domain-containing protein [Thermoanaerobaculia bacterium]